jgi:hypothetical protein
MTTSYRELGKARANPYARKDNNLKLDDCLDADTCMDTLTSATIAGTEVITAVVFNGQTFLPSADVETPDGEVIMKAPGTITAADTAELKAWLEAIAKTAEFDVYITVTHDTTTLTVTHVGQKTLTSITTDAPETITGSRCCLLYDVFTNSISLAGGAIATITVDGVDASLDTGTYADGDDTAQLVTDIKAELTALSIPFSSVTATWDAGDSEHDVVIVSTGRIIAFDSTNAVNSASSEAFICP